MKSKPLISVIIPTYKRRDLLPNAISSVLNQSYKNVECIIVNDCPEVPVDDVVDRFNDKRIKLINHEKNRGLGAARNTGLDNCSGDLVNFLDDDDQIYNLHLAILQDYLSKSTSRVVYANCVQAVYQKQADNSPRLLGKQIVWDFDYDHDLLLVQNLNPVLGYLFDHRLLDGGIRVREDLKVLEDWCFWIELSELTPFEHLRIATSEYAWQMDGSTMSSSRDFITPLRKIYLRNIEYAHDKVWVATAMNNVLTRYGRSPLFSFTNIENHP